MLRPGQQLVVAAFLRDGSCPLQQLAEMVLDAHAASDGGVLVSRVHHLVAILLPLKINYKQAITIAMSSLITSPLT